VGFLSSRSTRLTIVCDNPAFAATAFIERPSLSRFWRRRRTTEELTASTLDFATRKAYRKNSLTRYVPIGTSSA